MSKTLEQRLQNSTIKPGLNKFHNAISIGLDFANGWVKISSDLPEWKDILYLNTISEVNEESYESFKKGIGTDEVFKVDGKYYIVGKMIDDSLGYRRQLDFSSQFGKERYERPEWQSAFKVAVYQVLKTRLEHGAGNAKIFVTYGLSTDDNKMNSLKKYLKEVFSEVKHKVNDLEFEFELFFLPQAVAVGFNDLHLFEEGKLIKNVKFIASTMVDSARSSRMLYADLGWGTADMAYFLGNVRDKDKVIQLPGMQKAFQNIYDRVCRTEEGEWVSGYKLSYLEPQIRAGKAISERGEYVDITDIFNEEMSLYAKDIIDAMYRTPFEKLQYDLVKFTGGPVAILEPFLKEAANSKHKIEEQRKIYKYCKNSQFANAHGYLKNSQARKAKYIESK